MIPLAAGMISAARAQNSAGSTGTANATIVAADAASKISVSHSPFFGLEGSLGAGNAKYSGSAAKITTSLTGGNASVLATGEPGYEVNVCVTFAGELVSRDGTGGKLRSGVSLVNSSEGSSNRTSAQLNGSGGEMKFLVSAMSPDASGSPHGNYVGTFDVTITYN